MSFFDKLKERKLPSILSVLEKSDCDAISFTIPKQNQRLQIGWVLWHINHCRLFNAKSSLYIYIKYI